METEKADWKERVEKERLELFGRLLALRRFIKSDRFESLNEAHQNLLLKQRYLMAKYHEVLFKRLQVVSNGE